jgi:hypothetical protein
MYDHALNAALPAPLPADPTGASAADAALEAVLQRFFIRVSYPNAYVSQHLSEGFFSKGHAELQLPCVVRRPAPVAPKDLVPSSSLQRREPPFFAFWSKSEVFMATNSKANGKASGRAGSQRMQPPKKATNDIAVHKMFSGERLTVLCSAEAARITPEIELKATVGSARTRASSSGAAKALLGV